MPKVPYRPDPRPPRQTPILPPVAAPVCSACEGRRFQFGSTGLEVKCWVCKGTGKPLPPPPSGNPDTFGPPPWTGPAADDPILNECRDHRCPDRKGGTHKHTSTPRGSTGVVWLN